jgi:CelD/BcsL family acetyltransferase involved in cellulose biosynthesis
VREQGGTAKEAMGDVLAAMKKHAMPDVPLVTDWSVVHQASKTDAMQAARVLSAAAAKRDADKVAKCRGSADGGVYDFVPLSMQRMGGWASWPRGSSTR